MFIAITYNCYSCRLWRKFQPDKWHVYIAQLSERVRQQPRLSLLHSRVTRKNCLHQHNLFYWTQQRSNTGRPYSLLHSFTMNGQTFKLFCNLKFFIDSLNESIYILQIYDGPNINSWQVATFSGGESTSIYRSSRIEMLVRFTSDNNGGITNYYGFNATYRTENNIPGMIIIHVFKFKALPES